MEALQTSSLQYVVGSLPQGGAGLSVIPQDPLATYVSGGTCTNADAAFLETSRAVASATVLRAYPDMTTPPGGVGSPTPSSPQRPFLSPEASYTIVANASDYDSRGVLVDPSPRIACKEHVLYDNEKSGDSDADLVANLSACARLPARVFIANRSPATLLIGEMGGTVTRGDGTYSSTALSISATVHLPNGPSRVYLAPVIGRDGVYELRVFVSCYDANAVMVYDPGTNAVESTMLVGNGPYAIAFDPFDLTTVWRNPRR